MLQRVESGSKLELFETLRFDPDQGYVRLDMHLARMAASCAAFGLKLDMQELRERLGAETPDAGARIRITVVQGENAPRITAFDLPPTASHWTVALHEARVDETEPWRAHKTNNRAIYDDARRALPAGIDEWIFLNGAGDVCEGTITNVFVEADDILITPPVTAGALPGVLRQFLIDAGQARVGRLSVGDLHDAGPGLFVGNSLRGLIPAQLKVI